MAKRKRKGKDEGAAQLDETLSKAWQVLDAAMCFVARSSMQATLPNVRALYTSLSGGRNLDDATLSSLLSVSTGVLELSGSGKDPSLAFVGVARGSSEAQRKRRRRLVDLQAKQPASVSAAVPVPSSLPAVVEGGGFIAEASAAGERPELFDAPAVEVCDAQGFVDPERVLRVLRMAPLYRGQIVREERTEGSSARYARLAEALPTELEQRVTARFPRGLYVHQATAVDAAREGMDVVVSTPTSSGKSLVYHLPVLAAAMLQGASALYVFPTKALAQDQVRSLRSWSDGLSQDIVVMTVDGDTPEDEREEARRTAHVIITNPDMLHTTILPRHASWHRFFARLAYVVLDEAHAYTGTFGSHVAAVIRRLVRCVAVHQDVPPTDAATSDGAYNGGRRRQARRPTFVCCSATVGNPLEHFRRLVPATLQRSTSDSEDGVLVIGSAEDTSACGRKVTAIWNPPINNFGVQNETRSGAPHPPAVTKAKIRTMPQKSRRKSETHSRSLEERGAAHRSAKECNAQCKNRKQRRDSAAESPNCDDALIETSAMLPPRCGAATIESSVDGGSHHQHRCSSIYETAVLLSCLIRLGIKTLAFCKTRKLVELVLKYTYQRLARTDGGAAYESDERKAENAGSAVAGDVEPAGVGGGESLSAATLERLKASARFLCDRVAAYRGGYSKGERRKLERALFSGELTAVTATNALELGVDIGHLDCVVVLGFPGSRSSLMQQFGRAGRGAKPALCLFVCFNGAVDQFIARNGFLKGGAESVTLDPSNPHVLRAHLIAAAAEYPLVVLPKHAEHRSCSPGACNAIPGATISGCGKEKEHEDSIVELPSQSVCDDAGYCVAFDDKHLFSHDGARSTNPTSSFDSVVIDLQRNGHLTSRNVGSAEKQWVVFASHPDSSVLSRVSLRQIDPVSFRLVTPQKIPYTPKLNMNSGSEVSVIDTIPYGRAFFECFEGAIVMRQGQQFLVESLDLKNAIALCKRVSVDFYTSSRDHTDVNVTQRLRQRSISSDEGGADEDDLDERNSAAVAAAVDGSRSSTTMPPTMAFSGAVEVSTKVWGYKKLSLRKRALKELVEFSGPGLPPLKFETSAMWFDLPGSVIRALLRHGGVRDVDTQMLGKLPENGSRAIRNSLHAASHALVKARRLLRMALKLVEECSCPNGCPGCVWDVKCAEHNAELDKKGAIMLLRGLLEAAPRQHAAAGARRGSAGQILSSPERRRRDVDFHGRNMGRARYEALHIHEAWAPHLTH